MTIPGLGLGGHALYLLVAVDACLPNAPGGGPALSNGVTRDVPITGACGVPSTARAVALTVTATDATDAGTIAVNPGGMLPTTTASVAYRASLARASNGILGLGEGGMLGVRCTQPSGTAHVILDVVGYFQ